MWELIKANKRKTVMLFIILSVFSFTVAFIIAAFIYMYIKYRFLSEGINTPVIQYSVLTIGLIGGILGICNVIIAWLISYYSGEELIICRTKARKLSRSMNPRLFNILDEVAIAANISYRPILYATPDRAPNAYSVGVNEKRSAIVVTQGLLKELDRNELQGVIAHELAHIINKDTLYLTFAGSVLMVKNKAHLHSEFDNSWQMKRHNPIIYLFYIIITFIIDFLSNVIYFNLSKNREYLADATAIHLTRYPLGLASALEKIANYKIKLINFNRMTAPLYILNPLNRNKSRTHPPLDKRIAILKNINHGVNYKNYQKSYNNVFDNHKNIIPDSCFNEKFIAIKSEKEIIRESKRKIDKNISRNNHAASFKNSKEKYITCKCGTTFIISEDINHIKIVCPNCGLKYNTEEVVDEKSKSPFKESPFFNTEIYVNKLNDDSSYTKKLENKWESFFCECGYIIELSPVFKANKVTCNKCNKIINIKYKNLKNETLKKNENNKKNNTNINKNNNFVICKCGNKINISPNLNKKFIKCWQCDSKIKLN